MGTDIESNASIDQHKQRRGTPRQLARPRLWRSTLALAVSVGIADAYATALPGSKIRLTLNDEISSRVLNVNSLGRSASITLAG